MRTVHVLLTCIITIHAELLAVINNVVNFAVIAPHIYEIHTCMA